MKNDAHVSSAGDRASHPALQMLDPQWQTLKLTGSPSARCRPDGPLSPGASPTAKVRWQPSGSPPTSPIGRVMLGVPAGTPLALAEPAPFPENPALPPLEPFLTLVEQRPDVVAQRQRVAAGEAALDQARARHRPDLRLSANQSWSRDDGGDADGGSVGVRLNVPLYTGGQRAADVRLAEAQLALARTALEQQQHAVSQDIWEAWQSLRTATASFAATRDLVSAAEESRRAAMARYQAGLGDLINVLNAQSSAADARQQFVKARYDWARTRIRLARVTGSLGLASLELPADAVAPSMLEGQP